MTRRLTLLLSAAAIAVTTLSIDGIIAPAEAGKKISCYYFARDTSGRTVIAVARHKRGSVACSKAYNRCLRKARRASQKGKLGRSSFSSGICKRVV